MTIATGPDFETAQIVGAPPAPAPAPSPAPLPRPAGPDLATAQIVSAAPQAPAPDFGSSRVVMLDPLHNAGVVPPDHPDFAAVNRARDLQAQENVGLMNVATPSVLPGVGMGDLYNLGAGVRSGALEFGKGLGGLAEMGGQFMAPPIPAVQGAIAAAGRDVREKLTAAQADTEAVRQSVPYQVGQILPGAAGAIASGGLGAGAVGGTGILPSIVGGATAALEPTGERYATAMDQQHAQGVPDAQAAQRAGLEAGAMFPVTAGLNALPLGRALGSEAPLLQRAAEGAVEMAAAGTAARGLGDVAAQKIRGAEPLTGKQYAYGALEDALFGAGFAASHGFGGWWRQRGGAAAGGEAGGNEPSGRPTGPEPTSPRTPGDVAEALRTVGLDPAQQYGTAAVMRATRDALRRTHPDRGGTPEDFQQAVNAANVLKDAYPAPARPQPQEPQAQPSPEGATSANVGEVTGETTVNGRRAYTVRRPDGSVDITSEWPTAPQRQEQPQPTPQPEPQQPEQQPTAAEAAAPPPPPVVRELAPERSSPAPAAQPPPSEVNAAFRLKDGRVISTGAVHTLPADVEPTQIAEEGFVRDGKFLTRSEAAGSEPVNPLADVEGMSAHEPEAPEGDLHSLPLATLRKMAKQRGIVAAGAAASRQQLIDWIKGTAPEAGSAAEPTAPAPPEFSPTHRDKFGTPMQLVGTEHGQRIFQYDNGEKIKWRPSEVQQFTQPQPEPERFTNPTENRPPLSTEPPAPAQPQEAPSKPLQRGEEAPSKPLRAVEGQYAIPGTEDAVLRQQQVDQFATRLRGEYPSLRQDRPKAIEISRAMHDATEDWIKQNGAPQTPDDMDALQDAIYKAFPADAVADNEPLPDVPLLQRVVNNVKARQAAPAEESPQPAPAPQQQPEPTEQSPPSPLVDRLVDRLKQDTSLGSTELFRIADEAYGGTQGEGKYTPKDAYDALELAVNRRILAMKKVWSPNVPLLMAQERVRSLQKLVEQLPTQTRRTQETQQFQQFSTPPHYAYAANWIANIHPSDTVIEPSAGTGNLAVHAMNAGPAEVIGNELSPRRADLLKSLGLSRVFTENAEQLNNVLPADVRPSVVVMNPPFSQTAGRMGDKKVTSTAATHIEQALKRLQPGGRLVAIVGRGMSPSHKSFLGWWRKMRGEYNVRANVGVSGSVYSKYGTSFDTRLLVIDKTGKTSTQEISGDVDSPLQLIQKLEGVRNDRRPVSAEVQAPRPTVPAQAPAGTPAPERGTPVRPAAPSVGAGQREPRSEGSNRPLPSGEPDRPAAAAGAEPTPAEPRVQAAVPGPEGTGRGSGAAQGQDAGASGRRADGEADRGSQSSVAVTSKEKAADQSELSEAPFEAYKPERISIEGAKTHPTALVQSAAMAAVSPPAPTYQPHLPDRIIKEGVLSDAQLEGVIYSGQAHNKTLPDGPRRGFFVGDGTGVGKGREIAGVIMDNWHQGRHKAVWVSKTRRLFESAIRDWLALGGEREHIFDQGKTKAGEKLGAQRGVLFTGYDTLKKDRGGKKSRVQQIIDWLGADFDGVIAFDESHRMKNAVAIKGARGMTDVSDVAQAAIELQQKLPNARVLYVSATGATEVENLAYAERLGLWGTGTPFSTKQQFINEIKAGGVAAMELVARDMKAMGHYIARQLSFEGVEYEPLEAPLTDDQRQIYNALAEAWQHVLRNVNAALGLTATAGSGRVDGRAKSAAMSAFWGAHQRFFNQVITAMKMPVMLRDIESELGKGNSAVLQLVNTNEAATDRALAKLDEDDDLDNLDITPRDQLIQMVEHSFPVNQMEEYVDDVTGKPAMRMVKDSRGNPVKNPEAVAMREALIDQLASIRVPEGPLEILINHFGPKAVAEATGRTQRVVRITEGGQTKTIREKWSAAKSLADAKAFMDGKKRILVFSDAGGTGASYHADRNVKNQQRRVHYLVQPGWVADNAIQGFGRTHRSDQASAPLYKLASTDLKGEKRFISTIARRLESLGALTRGQRDASSQGLFKETDNLEGSHAREALQQFFRDLHAEQVEGIDQATFERQTGLQLTDQQGNLKRELPPIKQFLNRLLSLNIDQQDKVFGAFTDRLEANVRAAIANGTLDVGVETIKADGGIKKVREQTVYTDPDSGAETKYVELLKRTRNKPLSFEDVQKPRKTAGKPLLGFLQNAKSGRVVAYTEAPNKTTSSGSVIEQYRLFSPLRHENVGRADVDGEDAKWQPIEKDAARGGWGQQLAKVPEFDEEPIHLVTGAVLPIWDRLQGNPRIYRLQTTDGEKMLGRVIDPDVLSQTLERLGVSGSKPDLTPDQALGAVLNEGKSLTLANNWRIKRSKVSGEDRIELIGPNLPDMATLRNLGVFTERIQYQNRFFIPTGDPDVLAKVLQYHPAVRVERAAPKGPDSGGLGRDRSAGFVDIGALQPAVDIGKGAAAIGKHFVDWWSKPLIERVEDQAGKVGKDIATSARLAGDKARAVTGELATDLHRLQTHASGRTLARRRAVRELQRVIWKPGQDYGYMTFQPAVEGNINLGRLSGEARQIVDDYRKLVQHSGSIAVREGFQTWNGKAWVPFTPAAGGKRLLRTPTPEAYEILRRGENDPVFQQWADAIANANGVPKTNAVRELNDLADPLFKRNAVEGRRHLKYWPTHLRVGDQTIELVHADPFTAGSSLARNFALRAGYVHSIGQDLPLPGAGRQTVSDALVERFGKAGGDREELRQLLRALNGMPLDPSGQRQMMTRPGSTSHLTARFGNMLMSAYKSGLLTMAWVQNTFEPLSKTQAFSGIDDWARAWIDIAASPKAVAHATAQLGARTQDVMNLMSRPGHALEFIAQAVHILAKPVDMVNELNELHAAQVGVRLMQRLQNRGGARGADRARLRILGFNEDQVNRLTSGQGRPEEYRAVATRFAERTQGSTSLPADLSRAGNNRLYQRMLMFDRYPQMTANRTARVMRQFFEALNGYHKGTRTWKDVKSHAGLVARFYFGHGASGALTLLALALLYGGAMGLKVAMNRAKDDPVGFLSDAFTMPLLGGISSALYRSTLDAQDQSIASQATRAIVPVSILQEVVDYARGVGAYKDRDLLEKTAAFFMRRAPAARTAMIAGTFGLGSKDPELDAALKGFYDWRRDNPNPKGYDLAGGAHVATGPQLQFRIRMRRAYEAMQRLDDDGAEKAIEQALDVKLNDDDPKARDAVAESLRGRKVLKGLSEDELASVRKRVGNDAYAKLEAHDDVLEGWARAIKPPRPKKIR